MDRYYQILNLLPGASPEQIKKAYRKLAMRYHPDRNPGPDAREKFMQISEAYEYLIGAGKQKKVFAGQQFTADEKERIYEILRKEAERRARARYKERVREFRRRKEREQSREFQKGLYILLALVVLGLGSWFSVRFYRSMVINDQPVVTEAWVVGIGQKRLIYAFETADSVVEDWQYVPSVGITMVAGNGMPLKTGDRFELIYNPERPSYHRINFQKVSTNTMQRYFRLVSAQFRYIYYDDWQHLSKADRQLRSQCLTLLIFDHSQFRGLSRVYFHEANPLENFRNNSISWWWLRRSDDYQQMLASCQKEEGSLLQ